MKKIFYCLLIMALCSCAKINSPSTTGDVITIENAFNIEEFTKGEDCSVKYNIFVAESTDNKEEGMVRQTLYPIKQGEQKKVVLDERTRYVIVSLEIELTTPYRRMSCTYSTDFIKVSSNMNIVLDKYSLPIDFNIFENY